MNEERLKEWFEKVGSIRNGLDYFNFLTLFMIETAWNKCVELNSIKRYDNTLFYNVVEQEAMLELGCYRDNCTSDQVKSDVNLLIKIMEKKMSDCIKYIINDICKEYDMDINTFRGKIKLEGTPINNDELFSKFFE